MKRKIALVICLIMIATMVMTVLVACGEDNVYTVQLKYDDNFLANETKTLDKGTHYFEFSDLDPSQWGSAHYYSIENRGKSAITVYFDAYNSSTGWRESKDAHKVGANKTYNTLVKLPIYSETYFDGTTEHYHENARFRVEVSKKTEVTVSYTRYCDVKEVAKKNFVSRYWMPNGERVSDAFGVAKDETIAILYLTKNDARELGDVLVNENMHEAIKKLTNDGALSVYDSTLQSLVESAFDAADVDEKKCNKRASIISRVISESIVSGWGYKRLAKDLKALGKELQGVTQAQTIYFEKGTYVYSLNSEDGIIYAGSNYQLLGGFGYEGTYGYYKA